MASPALGGCRPDRPGGHFVIWTGGSEIKVDAVEFCRVLSGGSWAAACADVSLSSHLPPAHGLLAELSDMLAAAPDAGPFVGPDQQALEQMLATFELTGSAADPTADKDLAVAA